MRARVPDSSYRRAVPDPTGSQDEDAEASSLLGGDLVGTYPGYLALASTGELARRAEAARSELARCRLCPHECGVDRLAGQKGFCRTGSRAVLASYGPHFGEESVLVGRRGSGTVFLAHCSLRCVFCQNYDISHLGHGTPVTDEELAACFLRVQGMGCHNLNLVSPTHVLAQILDALCIAVPAGLALPIVWNTGGYESPRALALLDGVVDIYMPDAKYQDAEIGQRLSGVPDYPAVNQAALREMHRQVGDLEVDPSGLARRGLLVRHLVLPHGMAGTEALARFLAEEISPQTYINVMAQYRPCYQAPSVPGLERPLSLRDYHKATEQVRAAGLYRLDGLP